MGAYYRLNTPNKDGVTLNEELEQLEKSGVTELTSYKRNPLLDVECPEDFAYLFYILQHLRSRKGEEGAVKDSEILAYCELRQQHLSLWEVGQITIMDNTIMKTSYEIRHNKVVKNGN